MIRRENLNALAVKASHQAITIDGAFSEVYGDKGFTLVLDADRTYLAQHHHFESISEAITQGSDIIPKIHTMYIFDPPRRLPIRAKASASGMRSPDWNCYSAPIGTVCFPNARPELARRCAPRTYAKSGGGVEIGAIERAS